MAIAIWNAWGEEWALQEKVSFNGDSRSIYVHEGVTDLDIRVDIYSAWVRWRARGNDHFHEAFRRTGFEPIPGSTDKTGDIYFLINNWKLYLDLEYVKVTGVLLSDNYDTAYFDNITGNAIYPAKVAAIVNTVVSNQNVVTGDLSSVAASVWNYINRTLTSELTANVIATAVREAISVELARLDATVSSRYGGTDVVPANIKEMNNVAIKGDGSEGDKFRSVNVP